MKTIQKLSLITILLLSVQFCTSSTGGNGTGENEFIDVTGPTVISKNLGTTGTATVTITSKDFDGVVQLELDRSTLDDDLDAGSDIELSLSLDEITFTKNQSVDVGIVYTIKAMAPSFKSTKNDGDGKITLIATIPSEDETLRVDIPFQVNPLFEVRLTIDDMTGDHIFDAADPTNFRAHEDDLVIRFINMDPLDEHAIHANGGIEHETGTMAAAPSAGEEGGTYEATVDQSGGDSSYYCHEHGVGGTGTWLMTFNN